MKKPSHTHCSPSPFHASAPRTHDLMLLKAWHKIYGRLETREGGGERVGSVRLTHRAVPRCGTAGSAPPAAAGGGGRGTRRGMKRFPLECRR